jgi:hypothetical protein
VFAAGARRDEAGLLVTTRISARAAEDAGSLRAAVVDADLLLDHALERAEERALHRMRHDAPLPFGDLRRVARSVRLARRLLERPRRSDRALLRGLRLLPHRRCGDARAGDRQAEREGTSTTPTVLDTPLPVGISFWAGPGEEPMLFEIAAAYEAATRHRRAPAELGPVSPSQILSRTSGDE